VVEIVLKNLQKFHDNTNPQTAPQKKVGRINPSDFFKSKGDDNSESGSKENVSGSEEREKESSKPHKSDSERTIQDIADGLANRPKQPDDENKSMTEQGTKTPDRPVPKQIQEAVSEQVQYVHGHTKKEELMPSKRTCWI